jgi:cell division protein ZipA
MQANWSLILNVVLLVGVVIAIGRLMKARRQDFISTTSQPPLGKVENKQFDEIIAVRKIPRDYAPQDDLLLEDSPPPVSVVAAKTPVIPTLIDEPEPEVKLVENEPGQSIMLFLLAKEKRQLAGYELLQTLLASGMRFGEGQLFHRHQSLNGQGPVIFSLASATATGVFDLQNIGGFSVRGLCLFMQSSGNATIDSERLSIMIETAKQLSDDLDTHLLDGQQRPLTKETIVRYYRQLNSSAPVEQMETA